MTHNQIQETVRPRFRKRKQLTSVTSADLIAPPASTASFPMSLATALTTAGVTSVVVSTPIPTHVAPAGTIVVYGLDNNGTGSVVTTTCTYTSYTGSTFTISSTDFSTNRSAVGSIIQVPYSNRVVIDAYSISGYNTNAAATTITIRNKAPAPTTSVLLGGGMAATSGTINISASHRTIPAESGATIELVVGGAITGLVDVEVEGYIVPATIPVCLEYTGKP